MKHFRHSFVVNSDIDAVWKFYTDISHLGIITPKKMSIEILKTEDEILKQGTKIWLKAKLITKSDWHSQVTYLRPYEYVDEMTSGRFKIWKHRHKFNKLDDKKTEVIDEIDFEIRYRLLDKLFGNYVLRQLEEIFSYREKATIAYLGSGVTNLAH
jgi:ligand-binding SRPBCC domain-containing protein